MTLEQTNKTIPNWDSTIVTNPQVTIVKGDDKTGNLYKLANIQDFVNHVKFADLVTADGGFDVSENYNEQENQSYRLIYTEIICALSCLEKEGVFICKMFDCFEIRTIKLLWFISQLFTKVCITKPFTSRPANSERYLIAKGFLGISKSYLQELQQIIPKLTNHPDMDIFSNTFVPIAFINHIKQYITHVVMEQITNILLTFYLITHSVKQQIYKLQLSYSIDWCRKFKHPISNQCKQIQKNMNRHQWKHSWR